VLVDHGKHVDTGRASGPENLGDRADGSLVAVFPTVEACNHLIARAGVLGGGHQQIPGKPWIIRHHLEEAAILPQCPDHGRSGALHHPDDAPLRASITTGATMVARIADEASDDSVTIKCSAEIIGTDEEILASLFLR
jgi:hypothetical protein